MKKLNEKVLEVIENSGFSFCGVTEQNGEYYAELNQSSQAGEDWWVNIWFDGTSENFIEKVERYVDNFDIDEEVEPYIECRGQNGVPSSIKTLVEDAEWKFEQLENLSEALNDVEIDEED